MTDSPSALAKRDVASGYWGRNLARRKVGNAVIQLHEADAPPEMVVEHGHHGAHVVFVTQGAYVTTITGENGFVATPVAVLNPPGTWHRDHFIGGKGSFMTVDLDVEGLDENHPWHEQSSSVLSRMFKMAAVLEHATSLELEDRADDVAQQFCSSDQTVDAASGQVAKAWEAIMDSREPWTLTMAELASVAGLHPNSLPRAFRAKYGMTASSLSKSRQVELCGNALMKGEHSLAELAVDYGFYDQAHLTNAFKRITSVTPGRYLSGLSRG